MCQVIRADSDLLVLVRRSCPSLVLLKVLVLCISYTPCQHASERAPLARRLRSWTFSCRVPFVLIAEHAILAQRPATGRPRRCLSNVFSFRANTVDTAARAAFSFCASWTALNHGNGSRFERRRTTRSLRSWRSHLHLLHLLLSPPKWSARRKNWRRFCRWPPSTWVPNRVSLPTTISPTPPSNWTSANSSRACAGTEPTT